MVLLDDGIDISIIIMAYKTSPLQNEFLLTNNNPWKAAVLNLLVYITNVGCFVT